MNPRKYHFIIKLLLITLICLYTSCKETGKLTRRYSELAKVTTEEQKENLNYIHVNGLVYDVDSLQPPKKVARNMFSLSDHGQQAYVNAIAAKDKDSKVKDFQSDLKPALETSESGPDLTINKKFTKRIAFSVQDESPYEADRIMRLKIRIPIEVSKFVRITSISQLQTAYATVTLGSVNLTNALTAGLTASYGLTGGNTNSTTNTDFGNSANGSGTSATIGTSSTPTAGVGANVSNTRTMAESVTVTNRYVSLSVGVIDGYLEIYEESIAGVNLIGNVFADVTFETANTVTKAFTEVGDVSKPKDPAHPENKLKVPVSADELPISFHYVVEPNMDKDFTVPYECSARVRHVKEHQRTTLESDDVICYPDGQVSSGKPLTILGVSNSTSKQFIIQDSAKNRYSELMIRDNVTGELTTMYFENYYQAMSLLKWLRQYNKISPLACDKNDGLKILNGEYSLFVSDKDECIGEFIKGAFALPRPVLPSSPAPAK